MAADMSYVQLDRAPALEPSNRIGFLQRRSTSSAAESADYTRGLVPNPATSTAIPPVVRDAISSTGQPLDADMREFMEPRFGHDFSKVRVHTNIKAAESAASVGARAYTVGSNVVFGANEFAPGTQQGRELLAHELAHTIQQANPGGAPPSPDRQGIFEKSADAAARDIVDGSAVTRELPTCGVGLSRAPGPDDERAKAIAEAEALVASSDERLKEDETEDEPVAKATQKSKSSPKFLPGGFTDKEVYKEYDEAKDRMKLADLAIALAEKQVKRREFWATNPSNNTADAKKAFALDLYWDPNEKSFIRQPYVHKQEDIIRATPESKRIYDDYYRNNWENKPEKKGLVRRVLDPPVHFVCKHTNPCSDLIEQMHRDRESGMAEVDVKKKALTRLTIEGSMFLLPGKGPSGPIDISKGGGPSAGPFETPAFETGTPAAVQKPSAPANVPVPKNQPKVATPTGPTKLEATKLEQPKLEQPKLEQPKLEQPKLEQPKVKQPTAADPAAQSKAKVETKDPKTEAQKTEPAKSEQKISSAPKAKTLREDPQLGVKAALKRAEDRLAEGKGDIEAYNNRIRDAERTAKTPEAKQALQELKAQRDHQVELNYGKDGHQATVARLRKALDAQTYARPKFASSLRAKVWEIALKLGNGKVLSPSGKEIKPGDQWVLGHKPKYEFWKHQRSAAERGISREQFIKEYNRDANHYRPETPEDSSSHMYEDKTDAYLGF